MQGMGNAYVENGVSADEAKKTVGRTVIQAVADKYTTNNQIGKATIDIEVEKTNNVISNDATITVSTKDFEVEGTITLEDGILTWGEIEPNVPRIVGMPTHLELNSNQLPYTINATLKGTTGSITWSNGESTTVNVSNGTLSLATNITGSSVTANITASADGCELKTCEVTITKVVTPQVGDYIILNTNQFEDNANLATNLSDYTSDKVQGTNTNVANLSRDTNYLTWRVLEIDASTKQPTKIISADTLNTSGVNLNGSNGYNNAVYILNGLCKALYTTNLGITRSTKIEDLEEHFADGNNNVKESFVNTNVTPNLKASGLENRTIEYGRYTQYPAIAAQETGIWLNGNITENGLLGKSNQGDNPINTGAVTTATKLKVTQTAYNNNSMSALKYKASTNGTAEAYYSIFHPSKNNYWLASRCINTGSDTCYFNVHYAYLGYLSYYNYLFTSRGKSAGSTFGLRPIIMLNSNIKTTYIEPHDTTYNTFTIGY